MSSDTVHDPISIFGPFIPTIIIIIIIIIVVVVVVVVMRMRIHNPI